MGAKIVVKDTAVRRSEGHHSWCCAQQGIGTAERRKLLAWAVGVDSRKYGAIVAEALQV